MAKGFSVNRDIGTAMKIVTTSTIVNTINAQPMIPAPVKILLTISSTLYQIKVMSGMVKGLPFGMGALVGGLLGLNSITLILSELPKLLESIKRPLEISR